MIMQLLESKKPDKKGRPFGGTILSIILHSLIIFLAVFATARAGTRKTEKTREEKVNFVKVKKDEPPPPKKEPPPPKEAPTPENRRASRPRTTTTTDRTRSPRWRSRSRKSAARHLSTLRRSGNRASRARCSRSLL